MKRHIRRAMDGTEVVFLEPENEADLRELERLERSGELDMRESFGDDPEVWGHDPDDAPPEQDL